MPVRPKRMPIPAAVYSSRSLKFVDPVVRRDLIFSSPFMAASHTNIEPLRTVFSLKEPTHRWSSGHQCLTVALICI
jgi:hypothetical protein